MPKRSRKGPVEHTGTRRRAHEREMRDLEADGAGGGSLANHDIESEIFHGRIEDLFHRAVQAMDLVDEEHISRLEIREDRGEVTCALDRRAGGRLDLCTELVGDYRRQRGLAQTRRPGEDYVVERLPPALSSLDEDAQALFDMILSAIVVQALRTQAPFDVEVIGGEVACHEPIAPGVASSPRGLCTRRVLP